MHSTVRDRCLRESTDQTGIYEKPGYVLRYERRTRRFRTRARPAHDIEATYLRAPATRHAGTSGRSGPTDRSTRARSATDRHRATTEEHASAQPSTCEHLRLSVRAALRARTSVPPTRRTGHPLGLVPSTCRTGHPLGLVPSTRRTNGCFVHWSQWMLRSLVSMDASFIGLNGCFVNWSQWMLRSLVSMDASLIGLNGCFVNWSQWMLR